jgi:hypothetical protein
LTLVALVPTELVAVTCAVALPAGARAVNDVADDRVTPEARVAPKLTWVVLSNPLPCSCTTVPPDHGPEIGLREATTGDVVAGGTDTLLDVGEGLALAVGDGVAEDGFPHVTMTGADLACALVPALVPSSTCATYRWTDALLTLTVTMPDVPLPWRLICTGVPLETS